MRNFALFLMIMITSPCSKKDPAHSHDEHDEHAEHDEHEIKVAEEMQHRLGISIATVSTQTIQDSIEVNGGVAFNMHLVQQLRSRVPGIVSSVKVRLGDTVLPQQILAVIEAKGSHTNLNLQVGMGGIIISKNIIPGQFVDPGIECFSIADPTQLWLEFLVPAKHFSLIHKGSQLHLPPPHQQLELSISYKASSLFADSQNFVVRANLDKQTHNLAPGEFIRARINLKDIPVKLSVPQSAIQDVGGRTVVFVATSKDTFSPISVGLGYRSNTLVEITSGLTTQTRYVSQGSYILKADLMKSQAEHTH